MTRRGALLAAWPMLWVLALIFAPLLLVFGISFTEVRIGQPPFTPLFDARGFAGNLANYALLLEDDLYLRAFGNSLLYAALGTAVTLVIGLGIARAATQLPIRAQPIMLTLIMVPFWVSFLIRVYAWILILKPEGLLNAALEMLGLIAEPLAILNTGWAIVIGIAFGYLPFMILPIYAALNGQPKAMTEAAIDLGASPAKAFWLVTLPLARPGILAGCLMVFIPAFGEFVIPDLLGGSATQMVGQALWTEFFQNRDWPMASALAILLMLVLLLPMLGLPRLEQKRNEGRR